MRVYFDFPTKQISTFFACELQPGWNTIEPDIKAEEMLACKLVHKTAEDAAAYRAECEKATKEAADRARGIEPAPEAAPAVAGRKKVEPTPIESVQPTPETNAGDNVEPVQERGRSRKESK